MDFHHRLAEDALRKISDLREDVVDERLILLEMFPSLVGDLIDLFAALFGKGARVAEIFEKSEGRINRSGTRRVHAAEALFDFLDDLVAVSRFFGEQAKDYKLEVTLIEHSGATEWAAA